MAALTARQHRAREAERKLRRSTQKRARELAARVRQSERDLVKRAAALRSTRASGAKKARLLTALRTARQRVGRMHSALESGRRYAASASRDMLSFDLLFPPHGEDDCGLGPPELLVEFDKVHDVGKVKTFTERFTRLEEGRSLLASRAARDALIAECERRERNALRRRHRAA